MHEPNNLHLIICCLLDGAYDDGVDHKRILGWVEHHLGKTAMNTLNGVAKQHFREYQNTYYERIRE